MSGSDSTTVDLSEFDSPSRIDRCIVARQFDVLTPENQAKLHGALAAGHIANTAIAKWLKDQGLKASEHAVRAHRKGECCCER